MESNVLYEIMSPGQNLYGLFKDRVEMSTMFKYE